MWNPFSRTLDVQINLSGWTISMPRVQFSAGRTFVMLWHLLLGLIFSISAAAMGIGHHLDGGQDVLFPAVAAAFVVVGLLVSTNALLKLRETVQSTHLLVSGTDLRVEHRLLGVRLWAPQRLALKDLGPISFSGSDWSAWLHLGQGVKLPAFVGMAYTAELTRFLEDSIQQAKTHPDVLSDPPVELQRMLQPVATPGGP